MEIPWKTFHGISMEYDILHSNSMEYETETSKMQDRVICFHHNAVFVLPIKPTDSVINCYCRKVYKSLLFLLLFFYPR